MEALRDIDRAWRIIEKLGRKTHGNAKLDAFFHEKEG
jgi:hypothetical protein